MEETSLAARFRANLRDIPKLFYVISYGYVFDIREDIEAGDVSRSERLFWGVGNWYFFILLMTFYFIPRFLFRCVKQIRCIKEGHIWEVKMFMFGVPLGQKEVCTHCHKERNHYGMRF
jgi:hypothetical protein